MVNGWLPDGKDLGTEAESEWFRTKLERLVEARDRCFQTDGARGVKFVAWISGEAVFDGEAGQTLGAAKGETGEERMRSEDPVALVTGGLDDVDENCGRTVGECMRAVEAGGSTGANVSGEGSRAFEPMQNGVVLQEEGREPAKCEENPAPERPDKETVAFSSLVKENDGGSPGDVFKRAFQEFVMDWGEGYWRGESDKGPGKREGEAGFLEEGLQPNGSGQLRKPSRTGFGTETKGAVDEAEEGNGRRGLEKAHAMLSENGLLFSGGAEMAAIREREQEEVQASQSSADRRKGSVRDETDILDGTKASYIAESLGSAEAERTAEIERTAEEQRGPKAGRVTEAEKTAERTAEAERRAEEERTAEAGRTVEAGRTAEADGLAVAGEETEPGTVGQSGKEAEAEAEQGEELERAKEADTSAEATARTEAEAGAEVEEQAEAKRNVRFQSRTGEREEAERNTEADTANLETHGQGANAEEEPSREYELFCEKPSEPETVLQTFASPCPEEVSPDGSLHREPNVPKFRAHGDAPKMPTEGERAEEARVEGKADAYSEDAAEPVEGPVLKDEGRAEEVAELRVERTRKHMGRFLQNVCELVNTPRERKAEVLHSLESFWHRKSARLDVVDVSGLLALLDAVERAALPCLVRNARTGMFEVGRTADGGERMRMPEGWLEEVIQEVGCQTFRSVRESAKSEDGAGGLVRLLSARANRTDQDFACLLIGGSAKLLTRDPTHIPVVQRGAA